MKDRRSAPFFRAGIRAVYSCPTLLTLIPTGIGHPVTQQGQNLAVRLDSARTTKATIPFLGGHLRGRRDAVAAAGKMQSSPSWSRPHGFDGRERPMARPVAHHPGRGWGPRPAVRDGPLRADNPTRHTLREGLKERPRTHKLTAGGCRTARRNSGDYRSPVITRRQSRLERPHGGVLALQGGEDVMVWTARLSPSGVPTVGKPHTTIPNRLPCADRNYSEFSEDYSEFSEAVICEFG